MCKHSQAVLSSTKLPKDVCGVINEFADHHELIETRLYLNESIRFAYQDWLDAKISPGMRNNEHDCKMSIYTPVRPGDVDEMWKIRQRVPLNFMSRYRFNMEYFHDSIQGDDFLEFFREAKFAYNPNWEEERRDACGCVNGTTVRLHFAKQKLFFTTLFYISILLF